MPDVSKRIRQPFVYSVKEYLNNGWLGTIPLGHIKGKWLPAEKGPPPTGTTGARGKNPDRDLITDWCNAGHEDYVDEANIGLHLGEVNVHHRELPATYGGHIVTGWEVIGIDVDTYKKKNGYAQLQQLEKKYGALPDTVKSSARWDRGTTSYIALFLVPRGYRYVGKVASCIEVIQKRHRYMVVWPSVNPDADMATYEWRGRNNDVITTPRADSLAMLPEEWWRFLSNNGVPESEDPISDMSGDELLSWAAEGWRDVEGDMCKHMSTALQSRLMAVEEAAESHPQLVPAHWEILRLGAEGHAGWLTALRRFNDAWSKSQSRKRDGGLDVGEEIKRSVLGGLGKIQPVFDVLNDDPCGIKQAVESGEYNERLANWSTLEMCACGDDACTGCDVGARISANDNNGLGPVVGKLELVKEKPASDYGMHDEGNGTHFIDLYGDNIKYVSSRRGWTLWIPSDGMPGSGRWYADFSDKYVSLAYQRVRTRQEQYVRQLEARVRKSPDDAMLKKSATSWRSWAKRSGDLDPIRKALESAKRLYVDDNTPVTLVGREFDANPRLLGCANGILELTEDPELREPRREDYVTYNTGVPYIPWRTLATSDDVNLDGYHLWQEYLTTFLPDPEVRHFVQKVMGHLLIGENPEKLMVFLYGSHDTGKSTMIGAIAGALGDYYGTIDMNLFKQKDLNPQLIRAVPLRVTGMSEVDAGVMDAATVKRLTGNDKVVAEAKYSNDIFEGRPQFTTLIACNNPPDINHADEALRERILALPFSTTIDRSKRRYERQTQIERYSGIAVLSWLVEGWRLYCEEGIKRETWPMSVKMLHGEIVSEFNPTQQFIEHMLIKARSCEEGIRAENQAMDNARKRNRRVISVSDWDKKWTPSTVKVYEMYTRWCMAQNVVGLSMPNFTKELGQGRPQPRKYDGNTVRCYIGVKIRDEFDFDNSI